MATYKGIQGYTVQSLSSHKLTITPAIVAMLLVASTYVLLNSVQVINKPSKPETALVVPENFIEAKESNWGITFDSALQRSHIVSPEGFEVLRAVFAHKQDKGELITWENIIFDAKKWTLIYKTKIKLDGHSASTLLVRNIAGKERTILYWYEVAGSPFISSTKVKLAQAVEAYRAPNSKAEIIAFSVQDANETELISMVKSYLSTLNTLKVVAN